MKNINNLLLATFLRKKVPYDSYIKQVRCKNSKEYPFKDRNLFSPKHENHERKIANSLTVVPRAKTRRARISSLYLL